MRHSALARWWYLRNVDIPNLSKMIAAQDYSGATLEYRWSGGFGPGNVRMHLQGDGECQLTLEGRDTTEHRTHVSPARVHEVFSAVNGTGVLRLFPEERGYRVFDLGRFDIVVSAGGVTRDVIFDERRTVDDPEAFFKARDVILSLSHELGVGFDWGPYATTVGSSSD